MNFELISTINIIDSNMVIMSKMRDNRALDDFPDLILLYNFIWSIRVYGL